MENSIQSELCGNFSKNQTQFDHDNDSDDNGYMYHVDMSIEEREEYWEAVQSSKMTEWQRQQKISFFGKTSKRVCTSRTSATAKPHEQL